MRRLPPDALAEGRGVAESRVAERPLPVQALWTRVVSRLAHKERELIVQTLTDTCPGCDAVAGPRMTETADDRIHAIYWCNGCDRIWLTSHGTGPLSGVLWRAGPDPTEAGR